MSVITLGAAMKRPIDELLGSKIVEEKLHGPTSPGSSVSRNAARPHQSV